MKCIQTNIRTAAQLKLSMIHKIKNENCFIFLTNYFTFSVHTIFFIAHRITAYVQWHLVKYRYMEKIAKDTISILHLFAIYMDFNILLLINFKIKINVTR